MHKAHAAAIFAAVFGLSGSAFAQFACTTTATDKTCTNTGTASAWTNYAVEPGQNATSNNSGTVNGILWTGTENGGDATSNNSGFVNGNLWTVTINGGSATLNNSGTVNGDLWVITAGSGNATANNTGTVNGDLWVSAGSGNATANNTGIVNGVFGANADSGNAAAVNSGTVFGEIWLIAGSGSSTLVNSGTISNPGQTAIQFDTGNATLTILPGSFIVGDIQFTGGSNTLTFMDRTDSGLTGNIYFNGAGGQLTLDQTLAGSVTIGNAIYGDGAVIVKAGALNAVTLSGANTYTGTTTVSTGTLQVGDLAGNGSIVSATTVNSAATLRGTGTIGNNVTIASGGTLWPGATGETSGHTLTVNGNVTIGDTGIAKFAATGFVGPIAGVSNDKLSMQTYNLTVHAGSQVYLYGVYLPGVKYTLIDVGTTGTIQHNFQPAAVTGQTGLMKYVTATVQYGADPTVFVIPQSSLVTAALTRNQIATATAIDTAANLGTSGPNGDLLLARLLANPVGNAPAAFDALSGEGLTGQQQTAFNAGNLFVTAMMDQATIWSGGQENVYLGMKDGGYKDAGHDAAAQSAARFWATGFGQQASLSGDATVGSASLSSRTSGFAAGMDYEPTRNFLFGFAGAYSYSNFSVSGRATSGTVEGAHAGLYGVAHAGGLYLAGAGEYAYYDSKTSRTVAYTGGVADELAKGAFSSDEWLGRIEAGYKNPSGWPFTPFAGFQVASLGNGAFPETSQLIGGGAGVAGLHVNARTTGSEKSFVGLQVDTKTAMGGWTLMPYARASWEHEFSTSRENTSYLAALPAASFTVYGAAAAADVARLQAGIKANVTSGVNVFASFDGEFSGRGDSYAGTGGITIRW